MTPAAPSPRLRADPISRFAAPLWLAVLWGAWIGWFQFEWRIDPQYHFGFLAPALTLYLLWERWQDRPTPAPDADQKNRWWRGLALGLPLAGGLALFLFFEANPDYRPAFWIFSIGLVCVSLAVCQVLGGAPWRRHFTAAWITPLFAVPWLYPLETSVLQLLLKTVTTTVAEILRFFGEVVVVRGNVLELRTGPVGIEEACSGLRSLGVALLAAWFCGVLFRYRLSGKVVLLAVGVGFALIFNLFRTLTLCLIFLHGGEEAMHQWHNRLGVAVSLATFGALLTVAAWGSRKSEESNVSAHTRMSSHGTLPIFCRARSLVLALLGLALIPIAVEGWYRWRGETGDGIGIHLPLPPEITSQQRPAEPINETIRAILRTDEGWRLQGITDGGIAWQLYTFRWSGGRVSHLAGIHRPEVCLPSTGWERLGEDPPLKLSNDLVVAASRYQLGSTRLYVFDATWGDFQTGVAPPSNRLQRLAYVWRGQRVNERNALQLMLIGPESAKEAAGVAKGLLSEVIP